MKTLITQEEIMSAWQGDTSKPLVSISCITYNHESYIEDALQGFLIQETNFPFEILIHDDASTDKTANIIRQYEGKYPELIKPIYQTENQYSKGIKINSTFNSPRAQGEYIALCEGDDFWTDPNKLQKQVDFLESHKKYNMVFHNAELQHHKENGVTIKPFNPEEKSRDYTADEILRTWSVATASVVFRNEEQYRYMEDNSWFPVGDTPLFIKCASLGKLYYMAEQMSVYRKVPTGMMNSEKFKGPEIHLTFVEYFKVLYDDFSDLLSKKTVNHSSATHYLFAANKFRKKGSEKEYSQCIISAMSQDSKLVFEKEIQPLRQQLEKQQQTILNREETIKGKEYLIAKQQQTIESLRGKVSQSESKMNAILSAIQKVMATSMAKHPIKKYNAYKTLLQTYFVTKS